MSRPPVCKTTENLSKKIDSNSGESYVKYVKIAFGYWFISLIYVIELRKRRYTIHGFNMHQIRFGQLLKLYNIRAN